MTDKNNRQERIWNDPPMVDEKRPPVMIYPEEITLGAGVSPEVRRVFEGMEHYYRTARLISTITLAVTFSLTFVIITSIPGMTQENVANCFGLVIVATVIAEICRYFKIF